MDAPCDYCDIDGPVQIDPLVHHALICPECLEAFAAADAIVAALEDDSEESVLTLWG